MAEGIKKVIIADDEVLICELMKKLIDWERLNLKLAGEVYNGKELYDVILKEAPDIVITDISMPEMDGIELIGKIRKEGIPCHFIIVSGYRQFEYAHNALKYNVEDYILKPVDSGELNNAIKKLSDKIDTGRKSRNEKLLNKQGEKLLKRFFLSKVVPNLPKEQKTFEDVNREYGINFQEGLFQVIYVKSDMQNSMQDYDANFSSIQEKISSVFYEKFQPICFNILTDPTFDTLKIGINYPAEKEYVIYEEIRNYFERIRNLVDLFKEYQLTIGLGHPYKKMEFLSVSDKEAQAAVSSRMLLGCDRIIYWDALKQPETIMEDSEKHDFYRNLEKDFELLDVSEFQEDLQNLFHVVRTHFSALALADILETILELFLKTEEKLFAGVLNEDYVRKQYVYGIHNALSLSILQRAVEQPVSEAMESLIQRVDQQKTKPVRSAMVYVEENYQNPMRLEDVAAYVNLNPVYFSNIFKRETGENFTDYLTKYRMEEAKRLLRDTGNTIREIAEQTGYTDTRYFSKLFKKVVGIKPSEYRKIYG